MKVGDIVKFIDHSGIISLLPQGDVKHESAGGGIFSCDTLIVKAVDMRLPTENSYDPSRHNNVLLWNKTKGYFVCAVERFLKVTDTTCPHCGNIL